MFHSNSQDVQLYIYFTWKTRDDRPILSDDQIRQASYQAIQTRIRSQLCQVLAIASTPCQIHLIARFSASMPIKSLVSIAREAAEEAISRHHEMLNGCPLDSRSPWEREFTAHTVNAAEAAHAHTYIQQRMGNFHLALPESVVVS